MRVLCSFLLLLCLCLPAEAHRVNIFAYVEGDTAVVECAYNRSQKVKGGTLEVVDAATNQILLTGKTDDNGLFRFPVSASLRQSGHDLLVRIVAGEGHQNDWTIAASEFAVPGASTAAPLAAAPSPGPLSEKDSAPQSGTSESPAVSNAASQALTQQDVERIVTKALDTKLTPIRTMLMQQFEAGPSWRDIIGGIGWLVGLAGIVAYFRRRG